MIKLTVIKTRSNCTRKSQLYKYVIVSLEGVGVVDTLLLSNNPEGEPTFFNHLMNFELFFGG